MQQPQGQMHPEDKRNLMIFLVMCLGTFFLYNQFIHKPQMAALKAQQEAAAANAQKATVAQADATLPKLSIEDALAGTPRIKIDNPDLQGTLALKGGRIDDLSLRQYFEKIDRQKPVTLMAPARTEHPLYMDFGFLADGNVTLPDSNSLWRVKSGAALSKDTPVTITWSGGGITIDRTYSLDDQYMFTVTQTLTNNTASALALHPYALLSRQNMPADFVKNAVMHEGPIGVFDGALKEVSYKDLEKKPRQDFSGAKGWFGFTDKYWFSGIIPEDTGNKTFRFIRAGTAEKPVYQMDVTGDAVAVAPGASASDTMHAYVGPKKLDLLNGYKDSLHIDKFNLVIDFGKFWFLTIPFFHILTWLAHSFGSFAVALLVFTCMLRLAVFPLANKSFRSFARMRKIQPEMLEIREKFGDDRAKLQAAIFALYKRENVNPMAGCLPILIQIPIFFSLYKVLYISLEMRHAPFWGWIQDMSVADPFWITNLFGAIAWTPPLALQIGAWPVIMGFTLWMQQRLQPPAQDPTQAVVLSFMPIMMLFLMAHFPAGLVIYWSWSNCLSFVQQYVLMRKEGVHVNIFRRSSSDKLMKKAVAHGPNVHPAAEEIAQDLEAIEGKAEEIISISPPKPKKKR